MAAIVMRLSFTHVLFSQRINKRAGATGPTAAMNAAEGEVAAIAYHGNDLNWHVAVAGMLRPPTATIVAGHESASHWRPG